MLEEKQYAELVEKIGIDGAKKIDAGLKAANDELEKKYQEVLKGHATKDEMELKVNETVAAMKNEFQKLEDAAKEQGKVLAEIKENSAPNKAKSLEEVIDAELKAKGKQIKALYSAGTGNIEIDLKTAGVTSVGNTIQPMSAPPNSPWLPGAGGPQLQLFGLIYNPNFIMNYVSRGRTNLAYLPWANETSVEGAAAFVAEGAPKPLWNTRFKVEFSTPKKIAAMTVITEEFDQDLPGFTTIVERLLKEEVTRKFDDAIYTDVIAAATGFTITSFNGKVRDANLWDAMGAGLAQIGKNNYIANLIALNPVTYWLALMTKDTQDRYNIPPFLDKINTKIAEANKVAEGYALVGDMTQYKVDMLQDLILKVGWNMDDFQRNQFSVIAELRYHDYISTSRKNALAYYNLNTVATAMDNGS
jgi:hypothetical protein